MYEFKCIFSTYNRNEFSNIYNQTQNVSVILLQTELTYSVIHFISLKSLLVIVVNKWSIVYVLQSYI